MEYYRLEYNEKLGKFRYEPIAKRNDDRHDWETLSMVMNLEDIKHFINVVLTEFPAINSNNAIGCPKASEIKKRFNSFSGISEL